MIEEDIHEALEPLFGDRVYPDTAPQGAVRPFCTFQQVGGQAPNTLCGGTTQRNGIFQFNVWGKTREQSSDLMRQAEVILTGTTLRGVAQAALVARWDPTTRTYGAQQDISFWFL